MQPPAGRMRGWRARITPGNPRAARGTHLGALNDLLAAGGLQGDLVGLAAHASGGAGTSLAGAQSAAGEGASGQHGDGSKSAGRMGVHLEMWRGGGPGAKWGATHWPATCRAPGAAPEAAALTAASGIRSNIACRHAARCVRGPGGAPSTAGAGGADGGGKTRALPSTALRRGAQPATPAARTPPGCWRRLSPAQGVAVQALTRRPAPGGSGRARPPGAVAAAGPARSAAAGEQARRRHQAATRGDRRDVAALSRWSTHGLQGRHVCREQHCSEAKQGCRGGVPWWACGGRARRAGGRRPSWGCAPPPPRCVAPHAEQAIFLSFHPRRSLRATSGLSSQHERENSRPLQW